MGGDPDARNRLLLQAVHLLLISGDVGRALAFDEDVARLPRGPLRDSVRGHLAIVTGDAMTAGRRLAQAWSDSDPDRDPASRRRSRCRMPCTTTRGSTAPRQSPGPGAPSTSPPGSPDGRGGRGARRLRARPLRAGGAGGCRGAGTRPGAGGRGPGLAPAAHRRPRRRPRRPRRRRADRGPHGIVNSVAFCLYLARAEFLAGAWDDAVVHAERAAVLVAESSSALMTGLVHGAAALVPAARGDRGGRRGRRRAADGVAGYERGLVTAALAARRWRRPRDDHEAVLAALRPVADASPRRSPTGTRGRACSYRGVWPWADLYAEALVAAGGPTAPTCSSARTSAPPPAARRPRSPGSRGHAAEVEAALQRPDRAEAAFRAGLAAVEPLGMPFERGLLKLAFGEFLHDTGRAAEPSPLLDAAHARFAALGAVPYAQRTAASPATGPMTASATGPA